MPHKEQRLNQSQSQSQVEQSVAQLQLKLLIILLVLLALLLLLLLAGAAYYVNVWLHIAYPCKRASKSSRQLPGHVRLRLINAKCCLRAQRAQHYKMPHQRSPVHEDAGRRTCNCLPAGKWPLVLRSFGPGLAWPGLAYAGSLLAVKLIKVHANLNYLTPFAATLGAIDISRQTKKYLRLCLGRFIKKETGLTQRLPQRD